MKYVSILLLPLSLILTTCIEENSSVNSKNELAIKEFKLLLTEANDDLITKIEKNQNTFQLSFESGREVSIKTDLLKSIEYDSIQWLATFVFSDQSVQTAWFVSNLLISDQEVILNPYLTAPLTAEAKFKTPVKGKFKVIVTGKPDGVTIEKVFENYGENHELPILGLYENYKNQVEFVFMNAENQFRCSKKVSIDVPLIANKPDVDFQVLQNQLPSNYNGLFMVFSHRMGFDQMGNLRWYYKGEGATFYGKLKNGNFISSSANNLSFYEITMVGQTIKKYDVPYALHHEIIEMPSGNFLVASHSSGGPPLEDVVVEINRESGQVVSTWDYNLILDPLRKALPDIATGDWLHVNAMYFDETDNSIVISGRSQCAVVKIDYATGAIKWILGNHNYWGESFQPYLLKPVGSTGNEIDISTIDFWIYGQHAIQKTASGNILMYDNGDYRGFYDDPSVPQKNYTRLVEYKVNEQLKTVQLVWKFDYNKSVFTMYTGYAQELPRTHTRLGAFMWVSANTPRIVELDENNQIVFNASLKQTNAVYYRAYKIDVLSGIN